MTTPFAIRRKRTHHRSKNTAMLAEDFKNFSAILSASFPDARYYMVPTDKQCNYLYRPTKGVLRKRPPRVLIHHSLHRVWQAADRWEADIVMVFRPQWQPVWKHTNSGYEEYPPYWRLMPPQKPFVWFQNPAHRLIHTQCGMICVHNCFMTVHCVPGHQDHLRFANQFFRLLRKVANDKGLMTLKYPSGEIVETYVDKSSWLWVGHAARQWAAQDDRYFLSFQGHKEWNGGIRPISINSPGTRSS
jgi:hypothetical protein